MVGQGDPARAWRTPLFLPLNAHARRRRSLREGYAWAEDKEHCEEYGRMLNGDPSKARTLQASRHAPGTDASI